jgi:hypothetical protein
VPLPDTARALIDRHGLQPHPEGGWFRETWRAAHQVPTPFGRRPAGTVIAFLIGGEHVSRLHRLHQDEVWLHHAGPGLVLHLITPGGDHASHELSAEGSLQVVVPAGTWLGAEAPDGWALVGCACMPGFDFADLELGERDRLVARYPQHAHLIDRLTPGCARENVVPPGPSPK